MIDAYNIAMEPVWLLCEKYNVTKTQLALSFILTYPGISTVISGIRTSEHAKKNTQGLIRLDKEDMELIENTNFDDVMNIIQQQG